MRDVYIKWVSHILNDLPIAAIACTHDAILVTHNTDEIGRITGLQLQD